MDFLTALSTGASVDYATSEYMFAFMQAVANDPKNWLNEVSHNFVGQCFRALGLQFNVSVEAFQRTYDHPYSADNLNYIFNAVPFVLKNVELFFNQLPISLADCERSLSQDRPSSQLGGEFYDITNPVLCYLRVVHVWALVVRSVTGKLQQKDIVRYLCEPLARMSFCILQGLVKLLPDYGKKYELLEENCLCLTVLVRYSIFFKEACQMILPSMMGLFKEHFQLFFGSTKSAVNFVYWVFCCEMSNKETYIQTYQFLESMLDYFAEGKQCDASGNLILRLLTNELIMDKFLAIQFEMLKVKNSNPLLLATLRYLEALQRHLVSTDVFSRRFLEQLLLVLLEVPNATLSVCTAAAELYVTLASRQYSKQDIFMHILETFVKSQSIAGKFSSHDQFMALIKNYLLKLMDFFPALQYFKYYMKVLNAENVREEILLLTAHATCALFEHHTEQYIEMEFSRQQVHNLLHHWPKLVTESAQNMEIRAIIYGIYSMVDFTALTEHKSRLIALEKHCLNIFLNDDTLSEAEFAILFTKLSQSIKVTGNEQMLVTAALALQDRYAEISIEMMGRQLESPKPELLQNYGTCVRCLYSMIKENKLRGHQVCDMYETLASQMLRENVANEHLALYGYECLALMLILLHCESDDLEDAHEHIARSVQLAEMLRDDCVRKLSNLSQNLPQAKSLFCAIVVLHLGLPSNLTLNALTYDTLSAGLSDVTLALNARSDTLALSYVQEMHLLFRQLHENELIVLPTYRVWKLLLQYKIVKTSPDYITRELEQLILVLLKRHIVTYAHNLTVIQLHINNSSRKNNRFTAALTAHMRLVETNSSAKDAWLLRLHVFNASLELLVNRLAALRTESGDTRSRNNLFPLRHLLALVNTLRLEEVHFMNIARLLESLQANVINDVDKKELDRFIAQISAYRLACEDDAAKSRLKLQPPGPMTLWQAKAFNYPVDAAKQLDFSAQELIDDRHK
ncbi:uncharacterized protein LOC6583187 [Drosophila mojavensis]|uniref:Uncharacterized protein n=1 Tax=Drosophila mojavensis TaxID=7230 RepID=B4KUT3_DROMO|nr:uncharacterized protein LOC6583187 [Drosophila mojavensis]EDW19339.2 uncharacterized protein Dmoj_GI13725 [Drosophila mojavensis]